MPRIALGPPGATVPGSVKGLGTAAHAPAPTPASLIAPTPTPTPFVQPPPPPTAHPSGTQDTAIIDAIRAALVASDAFDEVILGRQEDDYTTEGIESRKLIIEPLDQSMASAWDGPGIEDQMVDSRLRLSFLSRCEEPQLRDDRLRVMINAAYNAMIGVSWLGETFPTFTRFVQHAKWLPPKHPVRRADAIYSYRYEPGPSFDTTE